MNDTSGLPSNNTEPEQRRRRKRSQYFGLAAILFVLIVCTGLGSVLINLQWPGGVLAWLRVFIGAVLTAVVGYLGDFAARAIKALRGGTSPAGGSGALESMRRIGEWLTNPKRVTLVLALTTVWFLVVFFAVPPLIPLPTREPDLPPGNLVLMSAIDESPSDPRQILIKQWNQAHPRNLVDVENVSGETDAQHQDMVADAKRGHRADIYTLDVVWMTEFIENGYIRRLDETGLDTADFLDNVLRTATDMYGHRDGLWALPFNSDAGMLYRRTDLPGVTVPTDWDAYSGAGAATAFRTAAAAPGPGDAAGKPEAANAAQLADEEARTVTAFEAMWAAHGEVVNLDGRLVVNQGAVAFDPNALAGLKKLAAAYQDHLVTLPDAAETDDGKATVAFEDGRSLFMRNWPVAYDELRSSDGRSAVPFDINRLPDHQSVLGGQNLAISSSTGNPRAAQAFIEFLTSRPSELILFDAGGFAPTRTSAYNDATRSYKDDLRGAVANARLRPVLPCYTDFSREFRKGVWLALKNDGKFDDDFPKELARIANKRC